MDYSAFLGIWYDHIFQIYVYRKRYTIIILYEFFFFFFNWEKIFSNLNKTYGAMIRVE